MQKAYVAEYIQFACMQGMSIKDIQESIVPYKSWYDPDNPVYASNAAKENFSAFQSHPIQYWCKYRLKGMVRAFGRKVLRGTKFVKKHRYPDNIDNLHD